VAVPPHHPGPKQMTTIRLLHNAMLARRLKVLVDGEVVGFLPHRKSELTVLVHPGKHILKVILLFSGPKCEFVGESGQKLAWEVCYACPSLYFSSVAPDAQPSSSAIWKQILWALLASLGPIIVMVVMMVRAMKQMEQ